MLNNILNLKGVAILNKKQQSEINGGIQTCIITVISTSGNIHTTQLNYAPDGEAGEAWANDFCLNVLKLDHFERCFYNCEHDGWLQ